MTSFPVLLLVLLLCTFSVSAQETPEEEGQQEQQQEQEQEQQEQEPEQQQQEPQQEDAQPQEPQQARDQPEDRPEDQDRDQADEAQEQADEAQDQADEDREQAIDIPGPGDLQEPQSPPVPEETDIRLPSMLLEVAEVQLERVAAELPPAAPVELPDIQTPLPEEGELQVADTEIELPSPEEPGLTATGAGEASLFSRGVLGAGSMNHIVGSISLYRLGTDPRLRFQFSHEGFDGYQFRQAGTGFFHTENLIEGWVAAEGDVLDFETEMRFRDSEEGLQDNPDFYSVRHRNLGAGALFETTPADPLTITGTIDVGRTERIWTVKAAEAARRDQELFASPGIDLELSLGDYTGGLGVHYDLTGVAGNVQHLLRADLSSEVAIGDSLFLDGSVGTVWDMQDLFRVPFEVGASGTVSDVLTLSGRGGFELRSIRLSGLWDQVGLLEAPDAPLAPEERFFGTTRVAWKILGESLTADTSATVRYSRNAVDMDGFNDARDAYPLRREERFAVIPAITLNWRWNVLQSRLAWEANLLGRSTWEPVQSYELRLEYRHPSQRYGAMLSSTFPFYDDPVMPILRANGYVDIAEGVRLVAEADDVLAPALPDGRPRFGSEVTSAFPFIAPGFRLIVRTEISL